MCHCERSEAISWEYMSKTYFVYIMTNANNTALYTGVTNDLVRRVWQHKSGEGGKFTSKYSIEKLVYFEETHDVESAILREKQIKAGSRARKVALVESINNSWEDLSKNICD